MNVTGVSYSSDKKLSRCEQQYSYRYDEKLKTRVKSKGLYMGDWMHQLLQAYYTGLKEKKKNAWKKKFDGLKIELWDKLFDEEKEMFQEKGFTLDWVQELMTHYIEHWEPIDSEWEIILVEGDFEMNIKSLGVPMRWKSDLIVRERATGIIALVETKNKEKLPEVNERMLNPQVHSYCYLLKKKKEGYNIQRIIWNYLCTTPVTMPHLNKDGSISKAKINTDRRTYERFLKENKIKPKGDEIIGVENHLKSLPETLSLLRVVNRPNLRVGEMWVRDWVERAKRAREIQRPTRNWNRSCDWDCDYKLLCEADIIGKPDRRTIIAKSFVTSIRKAPQCQLSHHQE